MVANASTYDVTIGCYDSDLGRNELADIDPTNDRDRNFSVTYDPSADSVSGRR